MKNSTMFWIFGGYCILVFMIGWMYWTYVTFFRNDWEEFKRKHTRLFEIIETGDK